MLNKLKLYLARRRLASAIAHENECRESARFARIAIIPVLEDEVTSLELRVMADEFYEDAEL